MRPVPHPPRPDLGRGQRRDLFCVDPERRQRIHRRDQPSLPRLEARRKRRRTRPFGGLLRDAPRLAAGRRTGRCPPVLFRRLVDKPRPKLSHQAALQRRRNRRLRPLRIHRRQPHRRPNNIRARKRPIRSPVPLRPQPIPLHPATNPHALRRNAGPARRALQRPPQERPQRKQKPLLRPLRLGPRPSPRIH